MWFARSWLVLHPFNQSIDISKGESVQPRAFNSEGGVRLFFSTENSTKSNWVNRLTKHVNSKWGENTAKGESFHFLLLSSLRKTSCFQSFQLRSISPEASTITPFFTFYPKMHVKWRDPLLHLKIELKTTTALLHQRKCFACQMKPRSSSEQIWLQSLLNEKVKRIKCFIAAIMYDTDHDNGRPKQR
jgi:hypothetical protein